MNRSFTSLRILGAIALIALTAGCATGKLGTPSDLVADAGFKPFPADTPKKQELLRSLPHDQVSLITWKGKKLYVLPDVPHNRAFVGTPENYEKYRELRHQQHLSNNELLAAQMQQDAMNNWNDWGSGFYGGMYGGEHITGGRH